MTVVYTEKRNHEIYLLIFFNRRMNKG